MSRKLHNTLMAVIASSSLLALGLIAGTPVMPSLHGGVAPSVLAALDQVPAATDTSRERTESTAPDPRRQTPAVRGNRQSVSMPFFSFVPRG